jgi:hypothetical protein
MNSHTQQEKRLLPKTNDFTDNMHAWKGRSKYRNSNNNELTDNMHARTQK